ncbi:MAG: HupE/UreJ family protein [Roseibium sp.]
MKRLTALACWLVLALAMFLPTQSFGHALQPGFAAIEQIGEDSWKVFWRRPDVSGRPMPIDLVLPEGCSPDRGSAAVQRQGAWETAWVATCLDGVSGKTLLIEGLEKTQTDVLVRFAPLEEPVQSLRLTAENPSILVPETPDAWDVFTSYTVLGFEHILEGWDHLLFLFALLVLIRDFWRLVGAVTAFTVAHSITLAASAMGWFTLPPPPVEAVIALSIVFLASEIALSNPEKPRLSQSSPWLVTFAFGLLHGLGFAGALKEIGLPQTDIPLALLAFNIGVEAGQLAFVFAAGIVLWLVSRGLGKRSLLDLKPVTVALAYAIGGWSAYWFIERVVSFV